MKPLTLQEAFDMALFGIRAQGYRKSLKLNAKACAYRGADGTKCAVGHCIPDDVMDSILKLVPGENTVGFGLLASAWPVVRDLFANVPHHLVYALQSIHDSMLSTESGPSYFERDMREFAQENNLHYTEVPA